MAECIVRVHHPDLTPEEKEQRQQMIGESIWRMMQEKEAAEQKKKEAAEG